MHKFTTEEQRRVNQAKWLHAVRYLGEKWILMKQIRKAA